MKLPDNLREAKRRNRDRRIRNWKSKPHVKSDVERIAEIYFKQTNDFVKAVHEYAKQIIGGML